MKFTNPDSHIVRPADLPSSMTSQLRFDQLDRQELSGKNPNTALSRLSIGFVAPNRGVARACRS